MISVYKFLFNQINQIDGIRFNRVNRAEGGSGFLLSLW